MIVLASQSPRRKDVLSEILGDIPFEVFPAQIDERAIQEPNIRKLCLMEAKAKALWVSERRPDDVVIASDTMVELNHQALGKPKNEEDAFTMLRTLQGRKHYVVTAFAIYQNGKELDNHISIAEVYIEKMADGEIQEYIETGSPFDKAGAYGIQDSDFIHAKVLSGEYETVYGLPYLDLENSLVNLGIIK